MAIIMIKKGPRFAEDDAKCVNSLFLTLPFLCTLQGFDP